MPSSRVKLYQQLLKQAARELDERPNSEIVKHVATLRLMRESLQIRLLAGERVDPLDVLKLDECLKRYLPAGKPLTVNVRFANGMAEPLPGAPDPSSPPPPADTKPADKPVDNVVPLKREEPKREQAPAYPLCVLPSGPVSGAVSDIGGVDPFGTYGTPHPYRGR